MLPLVGAVLLYFITQASSFGAVYNLVLAYCLFYFPTIGLTELPDAAATHERRQRFPFIRMFATMAGSRSG